MLFSVEQAFVGRDKKRAPLKTSAWEASARSSCLCLKFPRPRGSHVILPMMRFDKFARTSIPGTRWTVVSKDLCLCSQIVVKFFSVVMQPPF